MNRASYCVYVRWTAFFCAWFLSAPAVLAALQLPPDYQNSDIKDLLKAHAGDMTVPERPTPVDASPASTADSGLPDLVVKASVVSAPGASGVYEPGDRILVAVAVHNRGQAASKGLRILLRGNPILLHFLGTEKDVDELGPGLSHTVTFDSGVLPDNVPTRQFDVTVKVVDQDGFSATQAQPLSMATQPKTWSRRNRFLSSSRCPTRTLVRFPRERRWWLGSASTELATQASCVTPRLTPIWWPSTWCT